MMPWKSETWLVVDTETTGVGEDDEIVELGALLVRDGDLLDRRNVLVKPSIPIPAEASEIHGITDEMVKAANGLHESHAERGYSTADGLCRLAAKASVLVGYNLMHFDHPLLLRAIPAWKDASAHLAIIDPLVLVRLPDVGKFWPGKGRPKLGAVAARLRLDDEHPAFKAKTHRAAWDCMLAARILRHLSHHLPDDAAEAAARCVALAQEQEADFQAWLAKQPPLETKT